jgi:hypothetical protein
LAGLARDAARAGVRVARAVEISGQRAAVVVAVDVAALAAAALAVSVMTTQLKILHIPTFIYTAPSHL